MQKVTEDLIGKTFGYWTVVGFAGREVRGCSKWDSICACGTQKVIRGASLKSGNSQSCGCKKIERTKEVHTTHGDRGHPLYGVWTNMRGRCNCVTHAFYNCYGGRGIKVCERWNSFANFRDDMGSRPAGTSLNRINNDGNYEPSNCQWDTQITQTRNTRSNRFIELNGKKRCLAEWSEITGIGSSTIRYRINSGMTAEEALTKPVLKNRLHHGDHESAGERFERARGEV